jgi:hypothetical protein
MGVYGAYYRYGLFVVYQVYRIADQFSISLFLLTIFDLIIIYLTQKEYRRTWPGGKLKSLLPRVISLLLPVHAAALCSFWACRHGLPGLQHH